MKPERKVLRDEMIEVIEVLNRNNVPIPDKRRKAIQAAINLLLMDKDITASQAGYYSGLVKQLKAFEKTL
jgi:hypothetical protein